MSRGIRGLRGPTIKEDAWEEVWDENQKKSYFWNKTTDATTWEKPDSTNIKYLENKPAETAPSEEPISSAKPARGGPAMKLGGQSASGEVAKPEPPEEPMATGPSRGTRGPPIKAKAKPESEPEASVAEPAVEPADRASRGLARGLRGPAPVTGAKTETPQPTEVEAQPAESACDATAGSESSAPPEIKPAMGADDVESDGQTRGPALRGNRAPRNVVATTKKSPTVEVVPVEEVEALSSCLEVKVTVTKITDWGPDPRADNLAHAKLEKDKIVETFYFNTSGHLACYSSPAYTSGTGTFSKLKRSFKMTFRENDRLELIWEGEYDTRGKFFDASLSHLGWFAPYGVEYDEKKIRRRLVYGFIEIKEISDGTIQAILAARLKEVQEAEEKAALYRRIAEKQKASSPKSTTTTSSSSSSATTKPSNSTSSSSNATKEKETKPAKPVHDPNCVCQNYKRPDCVGTVHQGSVIIICTNCLKSSTGSVGDHCCACKGKLANKSRCLSCKGHSTSPGGGAGSSGPARSQAGGSPSCIKCNKAYDKITTRECHICGDCNKKLEAGQKCLYDLCKNM